MTEKAFLPGKYNSSIRLVFQSKPLIGESKLLIGESKALIAQTKALIGKNATVFPQKVPLARKHLQAENAERCLSFKALNIKQSEHLKGFFTKPPVIRAREKGKRMGMPKNNFTKGSSYNNFL